MIRIRVRSTRQEQTQMVAPYAGFLGRFQINLDRDIGGKNRRGVSGWNRRSPPPRGQGFHTGLVDVRKGHAHTGGQTHDGGQEIGPRGHHDQANIPLDGFQASESVPVANLVIGTGDSLVGPALGVSDGWVYVLWSILRQSGLSAGTAITEYVSFPVDAPGLSNSAEIGIRQDEEQVYLPYEGGLALTQLAAPPENPWESTNFILVDMEKYR